MIHLRQSGGGQGLVSEPEATPPMPPEFYTSHSRPSTPRSLLVSDFPDQELPDLTGRYVIVGHFIRVLPEGTTQEGYEETATSLRDLFNSFLDELIDGEILGKQVKDSAASDA